jgi:hypothetical protein
MKNFFNEGSKIHNFISSSGSGTVINYGSRSDFLTSYGSGSGSGSTSQKVTVLVPQRWFQEIFRFWNKTMHEYVNLCFLVKCYLRKLALEYKVSMQLDPKPSKIIDTR